MARQHFEQGGAIEGFCHHLELTVAFVARRGPGVVAGHHHDGKPRVPAAQFVPTLTAGLILWQFIAGVLSESSTVYARQWLATLENYAFKKLGATSRAIDAGSWAASGVLMLLVQALL